MVCYEPGYKWIGWIFVFLAGAFAGTVKAVRGYVSGDGFGIPSILDKPLLLRTFQRTFTSLAFLLPNKKFWEPDEVRWVASLVKL